LRTYAAGTTDAVARAASVIDITLRLLTLLPFGVAVPALLYMFWPTLTRPGCSELYGGAFQIPAFLACLAERRVHLFGGQLAVVMSILIGKAAIFALRSRKPAAPETESATAKQNVTKPKGD